MVKKTSDLFEKEVLLDTSCDDCLVSSRRHFCAYCYNCFDKKTYMNFRSEQTNYASAAKKYWQMIYDNNAMYLDKNFLTEFPRAFYSRLWELIIIQYLQSYRFKEVKLVTQVGKKSKPDFCFKTDNRLFYVENICVSPQKKPIFEEKNSNELIFKTSFGGLAEHNASYKECLSSPIIPFFLILKLMYLVIGKDERRKQETIFY